MSNSQQDGGMKGQYRHKQADRTKRKGERNGEEKSVDTLRQTIGRPGKHRQTPPAQTPPRGSQEYEEENDWEDVEDDDNDDDRTTAADDEERREGEEKEEDADFIVADDDDDDVDDEPCGRQLSSSSHALPANPGKHKHSPCTQTPCPSTQRGKHSELRSHR